MFAADLLYCANDWSRQILPAVDFGHRSDQAMPALAIMQSAFAPLILSGKHALYLPEFAEYRVFKHFSAVEGHLYSPIQISPPIPRLGGLPSF
jgi:hypothetical protein